MDVRANFDGAIRASDHLAVPDDIFALADGADTDFVASGNRHRGDDAAAVYAQLSSGGQRHPGDCDIVFHVQMDRGIFRGWEFSNVN